MENKSSEGRDKAGMLIVSIQELTDFIDYRSSMDHEYNEKLAIEILRTFAGAEWQKGQQGELVVDKNFGVRLRAYIDKKLSEAGVKMPYEFWESIKAEEVVKYLNLTQQGKAEQLSQDAWQKDDWITEEEYLKMVDGIMDEYPVLREMKSRNIPYDKWGANLKKLVDEKFGAIRQTFIKINSPSQSTSSNKNDKQ